MPLWKRPRKSKIFPSAGMKACQGREGRGVSGSPPVARPGRATPLGITAIGISGNSDLIAVASAGQRACRQRAELKARLSQRCQTKNFFQREWAKAVEMGQRWLDAANGRPQSTITLKGGIAISGEPDGLHAGIALGCHEISHGHGDASIRGVGCVGKVDKVKKGLRVRLITAEPSCMERRQ